MRSRTTPPTRACPRVYSTVVPAKLEVSERYPATALKTVLLPELGWPTSATFTEGLPRESVAPVACQPQHGCLGCQSPRGRQRGRGAIPGRDHQAGCRSG